MTLHHKVFGQGPALIVLHGLFGSLDNWVTLARQWATDFTVYLVDQRNHGRSLHDAIWNYEAMANDLFDFMDKQGIWHAHLLGHSMGGKTVMQFADQYPERIDRLVVADMAPKAYRPHHTQILEALHTLDLQTVTRRQDADAHLQAKGIDQIGIRQFLLKSLARQDEGFAWRFNLPVIYTQYDNVLANIEIEQPYEGPTLFLSGGQSNYVRATDQANILEIFPNAEFRVIAEAGHWLHAEAPVAFSTELLRFLTDGT